MKGNDKFQRMIEVLNSDSGARMRFVNKPLEVLEQFKISPDHLDRLADSKIGKKTAEIIEKSGCNNEKSTAAGLPKIAKEFAANFGNDFEVEIYPLGVMLLEKIKDNRLEITGTATSRCTFSSWDGCSPDVDG